MQSDKPQNNNNKQQQWSQWEHIPTQCPLILRETGQLQCTIQYLFKNQLNKVQFAFCYPYTYTSNVNYLNTLNQYYCHDQFYFHKEILIKSPQGRDVHLITVTSHDLGNKEMQYEQMFDQMLFPQKCRAKRFKKPVVLVTARVHPGETAASYAMEGVIDFLTNTIDLRSHLLKKMFTFMIVPMINVDGVFHGHFRMDKYGKNLNRYYINPSPQKQPAIYGIKELAEHLAKDNRLAFYFDLHAHNAKKGAFIYGNAINDFVEQVQSQVFCKIFGMNHKGFEYNMCNFSQKQMNAKDHNQEMTKQGCGRVVMHRIANIIHSYSLQCGIISASCTNNLPEPMNTHFSLKQKGFIPDILQKQTKPPSLQPALFTRDMYRNLGKNLLVSILDVFDKNPYNRVYNSSYKSMDMLRRLTAFQVFHKAQRFRMFERYVYGKVRNINQLIQQVLNCKLHYRQLYNFYFFSDQQLRHAMWPQNIMGLVRPKKEYANSHNKRLRSLYSPKFDQTFNFFKDLSQYKRKVQQEKKDRNQQEIRQIELIQIDNVKQVSLSSQTENQDQQRMFEVEFDPKYFMLKGDMAHDNQQLIKIVERQKTLQCVLVIDKDNPLTNQSNKKLQTSFVSLTQGTIQNRIQPQIYAIADEREYVSQKHVVDYSARFKQLKQFKQITRLKIQEWQKIKNHPNHKYVSMSTNQSAQVRVRRLIKQQNSKKPNLSTKQLKQLLGQMIASNINTQINNSSNLIKKIFTNSDNTNAMQCLSPSQQEDMQVVVVGQLSAKSSDHKIFQEIKYQIKEELKRHCQIKSMVTSNGNNKHNSIKGNLSQLKPSQRIKSTNINFINLSNSITNNQLKHKSQTSTRPPSKSLTAGGNVRLPAINLHYLIISTCSKGMDKHV